MTSELDICSTLLSAAASENFSGHDPFDSLNSELLQSTPFRRSKWVRLFWIQLGKHSPINLRKLLLVPKQRNPKGIGLFISGLIEDYKRTKDISYLSQARQLSEWVIGARSDSHKWIYSCWGYNFDWQARAFYVPAGKPNIITTCYVARGLYELGILSNSPKLIDIALDAARFISNELYSTDDGRDFFAYIPGEKALVHNASLWGAAWCAFAGQALGDLNMIEQALHIARQSTKDQNTDGSWVYGSRHHHQFIDGFHTGYNLEALCFIRDTLQTSEFNECIRKGYSYYINTFIAQDGTVNYYHNTLYPIDMHSYSQAILTLLEVGGTAMDLALCEKVVRSAIDKMYIPEAGRFIYQKTRWITNRINYTRWTQAWAYYSLAFYNRYRAEIEHEKN
ncbi:MAG: aspartate-semialdehyde dehydrogenase [Pseudomonas sp.]|uniref:hypothetical protein n=1 Tax=Pseudomonas sp. TaxID=306 RepID=UPI000CB22B02|nr:hypothetical protein [Pseudomonas sp.]PJI50993.1 MAG: aspartate-semialdehyde dehydrogenase [Pseudomonas sp.]